MRELERKDKDFKISFKLNLCRAIISKFNFRFRNKLESLEIRQARVSGVEGEGEKGSEYTTAHFDGNTPPGSAASRETHL